MTSHIAESYINTGDQPYCWELYTYWWPVILQSFINTSDQPHCWELYKYWWLAILLSHFYIINQVYYSELYTYWWHTLYKYCWELFKISAKSSVHTGYQPYCYIHASDQQYCWELHKHWWRMCCWARSPQTTYISRTLGICFPWKCLHLTISLLCLLWYSPLQCNERRPARNLLSFCALYGASELLIWV